MDETLCISECKTMCQCMYTACVPVFMCVLFCVECAFYMYVYSVITIRATSVSSRHIKDISALKGHF